MYSDRKEVKQSLSADDMILYIENPRESTEKLLEVINKLSKITRYKISLQNSLLYQTLALNNPKMKLREQFHLQ